MAAKRLVLFGAGMTGRGQVAQLAYENGWRITLVERNEGLVELLRRSGQYTVRLLSSSPRELVVKGFQILHTTEAEAIAAAVKQANLVVTSVLEPNLPDVGKILAPALFPRLEMETPLPLNVIAAENMEHSSSNLRIYVRENLDPGLVELFDRSIAFPNSMISRVVPIAEDPLFIVTEEYSEWTADQNSQIGAPPVLKGLEWVTNQNARLERKLFIHNTGHVICGYLGWLAGYRYIHEAGMDPEIMGHIRGAIAESGEAVSRSHQFPRAVVKAYEEHLLKRLVISALVDDLRRVIRHPLRKLGREERLVGPLLLCEKFDLPRAELCYGIAAVLVGCMIPYDYREYDDQSERIRKSLDRKGPVETLKSLVDFTPNAESARLISEAYDRVYHARF